MDGVEHVMAVIHLLAATYGHAFGRAALDVNAANHFVFGAARPVLSVAFGAESLGGGRPSGLADECFPGARRCFDDRCHKGLGEASAAALYRNCT